MSHNSDNPATNGHSTPADDAGGRAREFPQVRIRTRPGVAASARPAEPAHQLRTANYEVGYRKPPVHSQFKPGQSGNPRGRPKAAKDINTIFRETMGAKIDVRTAEGVRRMTLIEAAIHKLLEIAMKGDRAALLKLIALYQSAVAEVDPPLPMRPENSWLNDPGSFDNLMAQSIAESFNIY